MRDTFLETIAEELHIPRRQVEATAALLADGGTIPFIARYRKEQTGSLDEVAVAGIRDRLEQLQALAERREAIVKSLVERQLLTDDLAAALEGAATLTALEDIYQPYRPKRRTRAMIAREKGLEPLADLLWAQDPATDPSGGAAPFVNQEAGVATADEALAGARDILAERVSDDTAARMAVRSLFTTKGVLRSKVVPGKEVDGAKFKDYFEWEEPAAKAPSHRILAIRRGETEGVLTSRLMPPEDEAIVLLNGMFLKNASPAAEQVRLAIEDGYRRLLEPSIETEARLEAKQRADAEAIRVFAANLRELLLCPAPRRKDRPGHRPWLPDRMQDRVPGPAREAPPPRRHLHRAVRPAARRRPADRPGAMQSLSDRSRGDRQRHGEPRDGSLRPRAGPAPCDLRGRRERERRIRLLRLRGRARRVPGSGHHRAGRRVHRPAPDGPAGGAGEDRSQVHRGGPVPARRGPESPQALARRGGRELRERRGGRSQHRQQAAPELCVRSERRDRGQHRPPPERARPVHVTPGPAQGETSGPEGVRAGGRIPAHPRRGEPPRRQRRTPGKLRRGGTHGRRPRLHGAGSHGPSGPPRPDPAGAVPHRHGRPADVAGHPRGTRQARPRPARSSSSPLPSPRA